MSHFYASLDISLSEIKENYRLLASRLKSGRCGAAVKANAYGLGIERVAPALAKTGCRDFFVATFEEGLQLRPILKTARIYVINGLTKPDLAECIAQRLIPVLNTRAQLELWAKKGKGPSVLQIDTGMNRLGFSSDEAEKLDPALATRARVGLIMSHLASADILKHPQNRDQLARFKSVLRHLPGIPASLANSSGIYLGKDYHFDLARPGCALYGINPTPHAKNPMRPVATLSAPILQLRTIDEPRGIGYGATYTAQKGARIATLGIGYADGFFRHLGNVAHGYVGNVKVPVVGRVSMDMITVDVSHVPSKLLESGSRVEFIGPHQSVDAFADIAGTIGYEVFTRIGRRVKRVYSQ